MGLAYRGILWYALCLTKFTLTKDILLENCQVQKEKPIIKI